MVSPFSSVCCCDQETPEAKSRIRCRHRSASGLSSRPCDPTYTTPSTPTRARTSSPGEDVRARVGVDGVVYVGSHGLELNPEAERWRQRIRDFASGVSWSQQHTELKGLTISFHFRDAADERAAVRELEEIAERATDEGLVARFGRKVLEVLPPIGSNKGTAVRHLLEGAGLTRALVAGDDTTDIDAFRAVDDMEDAVRVAVVSSESPTLLRDYADIVVESTEEFLDLLRRL